MNIMNIISVVILAFSITLLANAFQFDPGVPVIKGLTSGLFASAALRFKINPPYFFIIASRYRCFHANVSDTRKVCFLLSSQFFRSQRKLWEIPCFFGQICVCFQG